MTMIMSNISSPELVTDQQEAQAAASRQLLSHSPELNRLLVAAVVSPRFCRLLLENPTAALTAGYRGQPFKLSAAERSHVLAIVASTLQEFAQQLTAACPATPIVYPRKSWSAVAEPVANALRLEV